MSKFAIQLIDRNVIIERQGLVFYFCEFKDHEDASSFENKVPEPSARNKKLPMISEEGFLSLVLNHVDVDGYMVYKELSKLNGKRTTCFGRNEIKTEAAVIPIWDDWDAKHKRNKENGTNKAAMMWGS